MKFILDSEARGNKAKEIALRFRDEYSVSFVLFGTLKTRRQLERPAIVSGTVTEDAHASYWQIFPLSPATIPEAFAKVNSAQFPLVSVVANFHKPRSKE